MKILILNYEFPPLGGGASPVSFDLAKRYVKKGHEVHAVTMSFKDLQKEENKDGVHIHRVWSLRKNKETCTTPEMASYLLPAYKRASTLHEQIQFDINHTHFFIPTGIISYFLKKRKQLDFVITAHGSDIPGFNTDRFQLMHGFTRPILKSIGRSAKKIISPSLYLKDLIHENIDPGLEVEKIPNGIDISKFKKKKKQKIILTSGRALPRKGFQHLIRAIRDKKTEWELHIAGDGPYLDQLKKEAKGSKSKIVFHGWVEKKRVKELCEKAAIYALVSESENASIALLEGLAAGCAMITTNSTGCKETVGDAGILVSFGDVDAMKNAIKKMANDYVKFGTKALNKAKEYDINRITDKYLKVLQ